MSEWRSVPNGETLTPGEYRIRGTVRGPYNAFLRGTLELGLRLKLEGQGNRFLAFTHVPPLMDAHGGNSSAQPWSFTARFERPASAPVQAGLDGRAVGLLVGAVLVGLTLALVVWRVEKLTDSVGKNLDRLVTNPLEKLLSPGTLVLAIVGIYLITKKGT